MGCTTFIWAAEREWTAPFNQVSVDECEIWLEYSYTAEWNIKQYNQRERKRIVCF